MAIQIKRSLLSAAPASLLEGELAYVFGTDTLYIGAPNNTILIIAGASTYAKLLSPDFTGNPTASTQSVNNNSTRLANTAFVQAALALLTKASVGLGNVDNTSDTSKPISITQQGALDLKAPLDSPMFTGMVSGISKSMIGLSDVDNTADANKPISTAQAAADAATLASANSYSDGLVVGLLNDRGNYDASGNTFPAAGSGSGTSGAIKKGDIWTVNVAGTLGGVAVTPGDLVRALVNTPGQTAGNWAVSEANIGYVAENISNKVTVISSSSTNTQYPTAKLLFDQLALKQANGNLHKPRTRPISFKAC